MQKSMKPRRRSGRHRMAAGPLPVLATLALLGAACEDPPTEPPSSPVEGAWSITGAAGEIDTEPHVGQAECRIDGAAVAIEADGSGFTGTFDNESISCHLVPTSMAMVTPFGDRITDGEVDGDEVRFMIGAWEFTGTAAADSMYGDFAGEVVIDDESMVLDGTWSAERR